MVGLEQEVQVLSFRLVLDHINSLLCFFIRFRVEKLQILRCESHPEAQPPRQTLCIAG